MTDKITPRIDLAFKKIFGVEENKDLLIALVNSIVSKEDQVSEVTLLNPYNPQNFRNDKLSILDIKAKSQTGKLYNVEIQISDEADYDKRALYYWAKLYTEQLQKSADYDTLNKAIGIHILNFTSIPSTPRYHNVFHLIEKESKVHFFKDIELHTIELNKFEKQIKSKKGQENELDLLLPLVKTSLDIWTAFLTRHDLLNKDNLPGPLRDPHLKKALEVLEVMNFSAQEREAYEAHLKWLRIEVNTLKKVENTAEERGRAEGRAEGRVQEKRTIAQGMLSKGIDVSLIAELTGLSLKELQELQKKTEQS